MVILRPTRRLRSLLPPTEMVAVAGDTALGDWYVNRIIVDRHPLLLLVSSASLLAMVLPARDVRRLPQKLSELVGARLRRRGVDARAIAAEQHAMSRVAIGPTLDRSVLGIMVDYARMIPYYLEPGRCADRELRIVEERLVDNPCFAGKATEHVVVPKEKTSSLLAKWLPEVALEDRPGEVR